MDLYEFFKENNIKYIESKTNFVTIIFDNKEINHNVCEELLVKGVIVRSLDAFGLPYCMRITIGTNDENKKFKQAFLKVLKKVVL